jgi:GTP pyrophosphokinase
VYPVDVLVEADDRQGLMRDVSEVFAKEKMNVVSINSQSVKPTQQTAKPGAKDTAWMGFTVEVDDASRLAAVLRRVAQVPGVRGARRR